MITNSPVCVIRPPKLVCARNLSEIVGEKSFENTLWISAFFAHFDAVARANVGPIFSPTVHQYLRVVSSWWAKWAKWAKTAFRPSPSVVGEVGESPIRTRPHATGSRFLMGSRLPTAQCVNDGRSGESAARGSGSQQPSQQPEVSRG